MNIHSNDTNAPSDALLERLERALVAGRMSRRNFMRAATAAGFASVGLSALAKALRCITHAIYRMAPALVPALVPALASFFLQTASPESAPFSASPLSAPGPWR